MVGLGRMEQVQWCTSMYAHVCAVAKQVIKLVLFSFRYLGAISICQSF